MNTATTQAVDQPLQAASFSSSAFAAATSSASPPTCVGSAPSTTASAMLPRSLMRLRRSMSSDTRPDGDAIQVMGTTTSTLRIWPERNHRPTSCSQAPSCQGGELSACGNSVLRRHPRQYRDCVGSASLPLAHSVEDYSFRTTIPKVGFFVVVIARQGADLLPASSPYSDEVPPDVPSVPLVSGP